MSTSTWGGPESYADDAYPSALLKQLLKQMIGQFSAQGACFALFDESVAQMRVRLHVRKRHSATAEMSRMSSAQLRAIQAKSSTTNHSSGSYPRTGSESEDLEEVSARQSELFAPGTLYAIGQDLIGLAWEKNEAFIVSLENYLELFYGDRYKLPFRVDVMPTSYLVLPICEPLRDLSQNKTSRPGVLGVIVLYQLPSANDRGFQAKQRLEAMQQTERIALYLQNNRLQRSHQRTSEYLQLLQKISTVFPTTVMLSELVEEMYQFTTSVVDVSSMLLTIYDRDLDKIYDVFAILDGVRVNDLAEQPLIMQKEDRPTWWQLMQVEKSSLQFSPAQDKKLAAQYSELLTGAWGDQRDAQSFLILPLKMFNRVVGSLSIASVRPLAYRPEEIQVLETMAQIVTVSMENAKLYRRDHILLQEGKQRELQLAAINSALQSISSVLSVTELLNKLVKSVAQVVNVDTCVFFLLSPNKDVLVAQALHAPTNVQMVAEDSDTPEMIAQYNPGQHDDLIKMIRLPFKNTILENMVHEGFFYLDAARLEELARQGEEGGVIFLQETGVRQLLMIPMNDHSEFIGILAVSSPEDNRYFRPKEIVMLLAICDQAVNAIRSAQLFEEREEAYAKLQQLDKLKDEFLVTASHELRTPLSVISGYSSLLKRHIQSPRSTPQQILGFVNKIARASQQLHDLVDKMTEATRIGTTELVREPVQILSAVEIAASMLTQAIEQQVMLDVAPDLWVRGDAPHLRQVLSNLLDNAAKYSSPNSLIYLLAMSTTLAEIEGLLPYDQFDPMSNENQGSTRVVLVRVQDQGEGILPQDQQRIFEKFYRAPRSLTTTVRGSGLGLYISRRYIEAMGGKLWLEKTVPNEGSTFSFYLPQVEPPVEVEGQ
jgi:signal transduction histidine kinase